MRMYKAKSPKEIMTLEKVIENFMLVKEAQHVSELTIRDYQYALHNFLAKSQNSIDYKVLEKDVLTYLASIPDTSPARYNRPYQYLNALFNWMVDLDYLTKNPIKANHLKKRKDEGNVKPIDLEGLRAFIAALNRDEYVGARDYVIVLVMLDTGIRTKEILSLKEADYNSESKTLTITKLVAKTREKRFVYLSNSTAKELDKFLRLKLPVWEDWLFPNYEGKQLTVTHLDKSFVKHSQASGIKITPYQLRHSFATIFLENGGDLFSLQKMMGHTELGVTKSAVQPIEVSNGLQGATSGIKKQVV